MKMEEMKAAGEKLKVLGDKVTVSRSKVKVVFDPRSGTSDKSGREWESVTAVLENGMQLQAFKGTKYFEMFADESFRPGDVVTVVTDETLQTRVFGPEEKKSASINPDNYTVIGYEQGQVSADVEGFVPSGKLRESKPVEKKTISSSKGAEVGGTVNPDEI